MQGNESYRREVTEKVQTGWRIEEETAERATLVRRNVGDPWIHLLLALLTLWWAIGVPNLLYGAYKYVSDSERTVVWRESAAGAANAGPSAAESGRARD